MKQLVASVLMLAPALAGGAWLRLESPHFELITNAGERDGRGALQRFEQIRHVFVEASGGSRVSPLPVRIYLFRSEKDFRPFRPSEAALGFYQGAPDRNYIAMQLSGEETYRVALHEYVHLVLNHSSTTLPRWLEEGTAEFYSTLQASGGRLRIGAPVGSHLQLLAQSEWIDADRLAVIDRESPEYGEKKKAGLFYAQSWALVHMMNMSGDYRRGMPLMASALDQAVPAEAAFRQAFGKSMGEALAELRHYLMQGALPVISLPWEEPAEARIRVMRISEEEAALAQLELLLQMGRMVEARRILEERSKSAKPSPRLEDARGRLALAAGDRREALDHFQRAIDMGAAEADVYFECAMLLRDSGGDAGRVRQLLAKAVSLNPAHAEAHFLRGLMAGQEGREQEAVEHYRRALQVLPRQSYFWHNLSLAYHKLGRFAEAMDAARKSLHSARTEQERARAYAAIQLAGTRPTPAAAAPREAVHTPKAWQQPQGDSRLTGVLEHIDCLGPVARLQIRGDGKPFLLLVRDPGAVLLRRASSVTFEFRCGAQAPRQVLVEFLARPDERYQSIGEITAIEFR